MTRTQITSSPVFEHILHHNDEKRFSLLFGLSSEVISDHLGCLIKQLDESTLHTLQPGDLYVHVTEPYSKEPLIALLVPYEEEERPNTEPDPFGNDDEAWAMQHPEYSDYSYWILDPITE